MSLTYRDFDGSDADYELLVEIMNSHAAISVTVAQARAVVGTWMREKFWRQQFVSLDGKCIGGASLRGESFAEPQIVFDLLDVYRDQGFEDEIYGHLVELARSCGAEMVTASACEDAVDRCDWLCRLGFERVIGSRLLRLDLEQFDPACFGPDLRKVEEQGITVQSVEELKEAGEDWLPSLLELMNDLWEEVPRADRHSPRRTSLEELRSDYFGPKTGHLAGRLVALDEGRCVGLSIIDPAEDKAFTGLTGVARSHRRRGIATALKVAALARAKAAGSKFAVTENEENNPMLQLNLRLGFRQVHATHTYRKVLQS